MYALLLLPHSSRILSRRTRNVRCHMPKAIWTVLKILAGIVGVAIVVVGYMVYSYSVPIKTIRITEGNAGAFTIGETKENILSRLPNATFSPRPKPMECPKNWIEVSTMTDTQRHCLLTTDTWTEGISSSRSLCPEHVDVNTNLQFKEGKLIEVITECWHPQ